MSPMRHQRVCREVEVPAAMPAVERVRGSRDAPELVTRWAVHLNTLHQSFTPIAMPMPTEDAITTGIPYAHGRKMTPRHPARPSNSIATK